MTATSVASSRPPKIVKPIRPPRTWWVVLVLATAISAYALAYVVVGAPMYPPTLRDSFLARPWGITPHALFGSVALGLGALQFNRWLLMRYRALHRTLGKVYVVSSLGVGAAGLYMSMYSFGGVITHVGFGTLAVLLLWTTARAYQPARARAIAVHRQWMLRSYVLIFAAVTLRIELPLLAMSFGDFTPAYRLVSWLCWVPNLLWAEWYIRRTVHVPVPDAQTLRVA